MATKIWHNYSENTYFILYTVIYEYRSVLASANGDAFAEDYNHVANGDHTQHPEFALARWAASNMKLEERSEATVYTSGEHCPMCSAAHGWVGLGRIVYASSSEQLVQWLSISLL